MNDADNISRLEKEVTDLKSYIEEMERANELRDKNIGLLVEQIGQLQNMNEASNDIIEIYEQKFDRIDNRARELSEKTEAMFDVVFPRQGEIQDDVERVVATQNKWRKDESSS